MRRRVFKILVAMLALLLVAAGAGWLVLRTAWFREKLRQRVIAELENATGGRVDITRVRFNVRHWRGRLEGLTIHGSEEPGQPPLFHAAALEVDLKVISFLERRVNIAALRLFSPEVHIRVAADGSTNIPEPKTQTAIRPLADEVLDLAAGRLEVNSGAVWWNDQSYALDLALTDLRAQLRLERQNHYAGRIEAGRVAFPSAGPFVRVPAIEHLAATFELSRDRIGISQLSAKSALSQGTLRGQITDFLHPRWQFEYEGDVDARELATALALAELKSGRIQVKGSLEFGPGENRPIPSGPGGRLVRPGPRTLLGGAWTAQGKLTARELAVAAEGIRLRDVALTGDYRLDPREVHVEDLALRLLGGEWKGRLSADYADRKGPVRAAIEGQLAGVHLQRAAVAFSTSQYDLKKLPWTAVVSGPCSAQIVLPFSARNLSAQADLTLSAPEDPPAPTLGAPTPGPLATGPLTPGAPAPPAPAAGSATPGAPTSPPFAAGSLTPGAPAPTGPTPLHGVIRGSYQGTGPEIQLDDVHLTAGATSVSASGRLREQGSNLQFRVQTARLEDLTAPAAALFNEQIALPLHLESTAVAQGSVTGTPQEPVVDAAIRTSRFAYEGRAWDSFTGRAQWSLRRLRLTDGRLTKGRTVVDANLTAELDDGKFTDRSPLEGRVSVHDTDLQDLAALAGQKIPVSGAVTAALQVRGTEKDLSGAGQVQVRRGTAWGEPFDAFGASITLAGGEVRFNDVRVTKAKNIVTGSGAFRPADKAFTLEARADNLALSDFTSLAAGGKALAGVGSFTLTASGRLSPKGPSLEQLTAEGNVRLRKLTLNGNALGDLSAAVRNDAGKLRVDIQSDFTGGQISGMAEITPRDRLPVQGHAEFRNLNMASVLRIAGIADFRGQILADGNMAMAGEALRPEGIDANGALTRLEIGWPAELAANSVGKLHNAEPVKWTVASQRLTVDALHLVGEGSDLRSSGWTELRSGGAVNFSLRGGLNLAVLASFNPNLEIGGSSTVDATVKGSLPRPDIQGSLAIQNASVGSEDLPINLSNGNGVIAFSRERATIQKLTAEVGGGQISLSGDAAFAGGPVTYHLRADARQVRVRYPRGLSTVLEGSLTFTGTNQQSILGGEIQIDRAGTTTALDLGALLAGLRQPTRTPSQNAWLQAAQLNVNIVTGPDMRFDTTLARNLQADANLRLRGTALNPALLGRINITQGELQFQGTRYTLNRGSITFSNPFRVEPVLNIDLQTRVSGYDMTLTLAGPIQNINVSYRSDPPLPFNELITLLAVGRAPTTDPVIAAQQSAQARSLTQLGATGVIGQALASPPGGSRLQRFFGVSRLKFDPELAGPEGNLGSRVTLEQQVGNDITFTYVYNLASAQEQIVRIQWALSRQFSIIAVRDQNGVFGVDFLYKRRYR